MPFTIRSHRCLPLTYFLGFCTPAIAEWWPSISGVVGGTGRQSG